MCVYIYVCVCVCVCVCVKEIPKEKKMCQKVLGGIVAELVENYHELRCLLLKVLC